MDCVERLQGRNHRFGSAGVLVGNESREEEIKSLSSGEVFLGGGTKCDIPSCGCLVDVLYRFLLLLKPFISTGFDARSATG